MSALPVGEITHRYGARPFTEDSLSELLELCLGNPLYYAHPGEAATLDSLRADLTALPPGVSLRDKYFFGLYDGDALVAAIDLIDGYRAPGEAYLGWFMLDARLQGRGEGTRIVRELVAFLRSRGFRTLRLARVKGNPQSKRFWEKNGFVPNGLVVERETHAVVEMELAL